MNYAKGRAVNLQLEAAERTVVRLLDGHKQPVSDAVVRALHVRVKESIGWPIPVDWADRFRATTDREGLATIVSFVPASLDRVRIDATASGRVEFDQNFFLNVRPREQAPNFDLPVPDSGRVEGQLNVSGADAPDIRELTLRTEVVPSFGPSVGVWGLADVAAEASGQFVVKNIAPGKLTAKLAMPENEPWRARVPGNLNVVAGKTTDLVIPVEPAVRVEGLICKQDTGQGYPDFSLSVIYGPSAKTHNNMDNQVEVKTDRDGKFSAYVPPGPIELRLHSAPQDYHQVEWWEGRSRGGRWGSCREVPEGVTKFELEPIGLAPAERVEGTLVDKDGNPLPGWMVFGFPEDKAAGPEHVRQKIEPMNSFGGVDTDQAGRFTGYVPKPYPPVRWKIMHTLGNENYKRRTDHYRATITSKRPLVLQVDVDKPTESTQSR